MRGARLMAASAELEKLAGARDLWLRFTDLFRSDPGGHRAEARKFLESTDADRWTALQDKLKNPHFVRQLTRYADDPKLVQHAKSMHALYHGDVVGTVEGSSGKPYDIKELPGGSLGCTCQDWKFRGSVDPGYECKHVRAHKAGLSKVAAGAPFGTMTSSFFDELAKIQAAARTKANEAWGGGTNDPGASDRPFSGLLVQDEEPLDDIGRPAPPIDQVDVIYGGF